MGSECKNRNRTLAEPLVPPGFASLTSFFLKRVENGGDGTRFAEYMSSSTQEPLPAKDPADMIDAAKLKSSRKKRPWILHDQSCQTAEKSESEHPRKVTAVQSLNNLSNDILEEAPVFHPTEEEFSDTLMYIQNIRDKAEPYGICRIVPPASWQPPCLLQEKIIWENSVFVTQTQQFDWHPHHAIHNRKAELHRNMNGKRESLRLTVELGANNECILDSDESLCLDKEVFESKPGPEFTLETFKQYADNFKKKYFSSKDDVLHHNVSSSQAEPSVEKIESEYGLLVCNGTKDTEVLYGSDLDTGAFGSGFPVLSDPLETSDYPEYLSSGWNLNNLPRVPGSLLSFEGDPISGVTIPRLCIGMCFSSLPWRIEEHHLYSLSYMHLGSPKVWYGVPGRYYFKFEAAMKKYLSDVLAKRLTRRLSPFILKSVGLPIYQCIQKPGEFVLTFPGAYYSGLDCGFNCVEAVNFAPLDWLPHGQMAVEIYQEQKRKTSISHDKLLIAAAREAVRGRWEFTLLKKKTAENLRWNDACGKNGILANVLKSRVKSEGNRREYLCSASQAQRMDECFDATIKRECIICFYDLHLSAAHCACSADRYSCLNHAKHLCSCGWSEKIFLYHYDISKLEILTEASEGRISAVVKWAREDPSLALISCTPRNASHTKSCSKGSEQEEHGSRDVQRTNVDGSTTVWSEIK